MPSYAPRFVDELDRLVRLLAEGAHRVADQKESLRALREAATAGEVTILATGGALIANGVPVTGAAAEADGLAGRLGAHGVPRLFVARDAEAADLLRAARALVAAPGEGGGPAALDLRTVRFSRSLAPPRATPVASPTLLSAAARQAPIAPADVAASSPPPPPPSPPAGKGVLPGMDHTRVMLAAAAVAERDLDDAELLARLEGAEVLPQLTRLLDEAAVRVEQAVREGDAERARALVSATLRREESADDHEARLACHVTLRAMLAVPHLRLLVTLLPRRPEARDELYALLARAGEEGADALVEHLADAQSPSDRRVYFNALVHLQAGVPALVHMLGDPRWYVVRNAAELLGELDAASADGALAQALAHDDARVRRAAATSLGRLATQRAGQALREALRDPDADVRARAALALAESGWPYAAAALRRALGEEEDGEAQQAIVAALGTLATDEAVEALAELVAPPRGIFRRRGSPLRAVAARALAAAATPHALEVLATLARDRDAEVREAALGATGSRV